MRYLQIGGANISVIGLGTWQFGSREWGYGSDYAEKDAIAITERALELGVNLIDTAEIYAFGQSERIVGKGIAGRRPDAFIATKVFPVLPLAPIVEQRAKASAKRLGIDRIDLYQVHWPNPIIPVSQAMKGMTALRDQGVINHVGVSNFSAKAWAEADGHLGGPVLTNQVQYNLVQRGPEQAVIPYAQDNDRVVIAYSPLAQGFLAAKYDADNTPGGVRATNALFLPENLERAEQLLLALREIAANHDATPAQVSLAWVLRHPNVVAIPGASSVSQLESNVAAADLDLSEDEFERLTEASDAFTPETGLTTQARMVANRFRP